MLFLTITMTGLAGIAPPLPESKAPDLSPPGLVLIEGGSTKVGTPHKDLVKLLADNPQLQKNAGGFLAETPQHVVRSVPDYYLMVTEVTHEQYHEFVKSQGARPPRQWGEEAITVAREAFLKEQGEAREKARAAGEKPPVRETFEEVEWWMQNWRDATWAMPEDLAKKPIVYVDYQEARAYAEWAGLRLMSEVEFERAVRGDTDRIYPWGDEWNPENAATNEIRNVRDVYDVGSFPGGVTEDGIFDLSGNVWEWTSSKYVPYPGWKNAHGKFNVGKGKNRKPIDVIPNFSPDRRVVRSGSIQNSHFYARGTTRGGFDRYQRASAFGIRCAASTKPGLDFANERLDNIPNEIRPQTENGPVIYNPNGVIAKDRWVATDGGSNVPGYAVIKQYDYILFTPAESIRTNGLNDIRKGTQTDEIFHIGFLATNQDIVEPALKAGTYLVGIRGKGAIPERVEEDETAPVAEGEAEGETEANTQIQLEKFLQFDETVDNYVFFAMDGAPVAVAPIRVLDYGNPQTPQLNVVDRTITITVGEGDDAEEVDIVQKWLDMRLFIKGRSKKGLKTTLSLRFAEGLLEGSWR